MTAAAPANAWSNGTRVEVFDILRRRWCQAIIIRCCRRDDYGAPDAWEAVIKHTGEFGTWGISRIRQCRPVLIEGAP